MLMNHPHPQGNSIVRRANLAHLAIDYDLAAISRVEAVGYPHCGGLTRAVFADDSMNRPWRDLNAHAIVCQHVAEAFGDVS